MASVSSPPLDPPAAANHQQSDDPPSYQPPHSAVPSSTYPSKPIVVQLEQRQAGRVDKPGFIETGDLIRLERDIILLPADIEFDAIVRLLRRRVEQRGLAAGEPGTMTYEGLSLRVNQKLFSPWVQLDKFSWHAARELLLQRDEAVLSFCFMVVAKDYEVKAAAAVAAAKTTTTTTTTSPADDKRRVTKRASFIDTKKKRKESCVVQ